MANILNITSVTTKTTVRDLGKKSSDSREVS